jgi:hypothetical protein
MGGSRLGKRRVALLDREPGEARSVARWLRSGLWDGGVTHWAAVSKKERGTLIMQSLAGDGDGGEWRKRERG